MRLRKQLLLASVFTLSLPWVGCQYIRELEQTLQAGQLKALEATAIALSSTLANAPKLIDVLQSQGAHPGQTPIYAHKFNTPSALDGYAEEWTQMGFSPQQFYSSHNSSPLTLYAAHDHQQVRLFFDIPDTSRDYYQPGTTLEHTDQLHITLKDTNATLRKFLVLATNPGQASVLRYETALPLHIKHSSIEHQIKAIWRESPNGYFIELELPLTWAAQGLGFNSFNSEGNAKQQFAYSNINSSSTEETTPLIQQSEALRDTLKIFTRPETRLLISSMGGQFLAKHGDLDASKRAQEPYWLLSFLYRLALNEPTRAPLPNIEQLGYFSSPETMSALMGHTASGKYQLEGQSILRVSIPILMGNQHLGAVIAEQNTHSMAEFTDTAFNRLFLYSLLLTFFSALAFVLYATWLSIRLGRLSRSASSAISDSGKINDNFRASRIDDEIGELSRSFSQLLARLREYTHYLKTLSNKLSHELRTPLAIVSSSLDNLEHETLSPQAKIYAQRAKEGSVRLSNILNAMSAASRVEQAINTAEQEWVPLNKIIQNLGEAYKDIYTHANVHTHITANDEGFSIFASAELLVQMLDKLIDNAADFCPENGKIELGLCRHQHSLVLTVQNEGPSLPLAMQNQLFDSMVSVRDRGHTKRDNHHLGLGLYIVRLIVDFHRGSVEAYNAADNSGVIFEVRLPIHQ